MWWQRLSVHSDLQPHTVWSTVCLLPNTLSCLECHTDQQADREAMAALAYSLVYRCMQGKITQDVKGQTDDKMFSSETSTTCTWCQLSLWVQSKLLSPRVKKQHVVTHLNMNKTLCCFALVNSVSCVLPCQPDSPRRQHDCFDFLMRK
jgi:hypothetical protein